MLKRDFALFCRSLAASALLLILLTAICIGAAAVMISGVSQKSDIIHVAVVDNEDSVISRILIHTVSEIEHIRSLVSVETMDEPSAREAIAGGTCAAAILLPDGFLDDIVHGRESRGKIYLSPAMAAQGDVIASMVRYGERLLVSGQYGVFAGERVLREHPVDTETQDRYLTAANTALLANVLAGSDSYFTVENVSYANSGLGTDAYFALCWLTALLFLLTVFFRPLLLRDCTRGMLSRLASYKIGSVRFMLWKIVLLTLFRYALFLAAICILRDPLGTVPDLLSPLLASLYITVVGACLTLCTGDGIAANTIVTLSGMLLCGGFVPLHLLPAGVRLIGRLTPFGAAQALIEPLFGAPPDWLGIGPAVLYTGLSIALIGVKLRQVRCGRWE